MAVRCEPWGSSPTRSVRMRSPLPTALLLALALGLAACDSTATFQIGGTYSGITDTSVDVTTLSIRIPETPSGGTFSFTGTRAEGQNGEVETPVAGTGTYDHPAVTLTVEGEAVAGTASDDGDVLTFTDADGSFVLTLDGLD